MARKTSRAAQTTKPSGPERLTTGIEGLDTVLDGGLLRRRLYLVRGDPGAGKTVLSLQLAMHRARQGERVVFVSMLSESHDALLENFSSFEFFDRSLVPSKLLMVSGYQTLESGGLDALSTLLRRTIRENRAQLVILDALALPGGPMPSFEALRRFLRDIGTFAGLLKCTVLVTGLAEPVAGPEDVVADGILRLTRRHVGTRSVRLLEVIKLRGSAHLEGEHHFDLSSRGIVVHPRLEAQFKAPPAFAREKRTRLAFGVSQLDQMLRGGVLSASTTVLLGAPGAGKTILGLHFLAEGLRQGEPALYFGFFETPPRLLAKAEGIGLRLRRHARIGALDLVWNPPLEHSADALGEQLLEAVRSKPVRRLFIDGIEGFLLSTAFPERLPRFFAALTNELRALDVTTMMSEESDFFGTNIEQPQLGLSALSENAILLRYVELKSQLYRLLSIVKVRESGYDTALREFRITDRGIQLAETFRSAENILGGMARQASGGGRCPDTEETAQSPRRKR